MYLKTHISIAVRLSQLVYTINSANRIPPDLTTRPMQHGIRPKPLSAELIPEPPPPQTRL